MEDRIYIAALFDVYGSLLNERQKEIMNMRLSFDYSLSEVGDELNVSRQAVHDAEKKSIDALMDYEDKLSVVKKQNKLKYILSDLKEKITFLDVNEDNRKLLTNKIKELEEEIG